MSSGSPVSRSQRPQWQVALAVAHAWLADSEQPGGRSAASLTARAQHCLGLQAHTAGVQPACPAWLKVWSLRLQRLPAPLWLRLDVQRLALVLSGQSSLGAACYPDRAHAANGGSPGTTAATASDERWFAGMEEGEDWFDDALGDFDEADEADDSEDTGTDSFVDWVQQSHASVRRWILRPSRMQAPAAALDQLPLPHWADSEQLAQALGISLAQLHWLTPPHWQLAGTDRQATRIAASHYRHRLIAKTRGGLRLLEVPKQQLAAVQTQLLAQLLRLVPAHEAAHGFVAGRSVHSHAALHAGQAVVCAWDLSDFFHSVGAAQIQALWRSLGYPQGVATQLTALATTVTPYAVRARLLEDGSLSRTQARRLARPHLAQGAPSSPALANLCAFRLDLRLAALAERFGAHYSRYADDLVMSGPTTLRRDYDALHHWVRGIVLDEGFALHPDKSRLQPAHRRQLVTGLVVNQQPNLPREDYDRLRAELHRLAQLPAVPQSLQAALRGRVAWACEAVTPARQAKLHGLLAALRFAPDEAL